MKLPTTRLECGKLYRYRRFHNCALTKFDMFLGGMICCSEEEFLYRKPVSFGHVIRGAAPCLCMCGNYKNYECNGLMSCAMATDKTLHLPWNEPLYGGNKE